MFSPQRVEALRGPGFGRLAKKLLQRVHCRPCRAPPSPRQAGRGGASGARPSLDESLRTGRGLGSICRDRSDPICVFPRLALEPVFPGRLPATPRGYNHPPIFHMHLTIVHMCNCLWTSLGKVRASAAFLFWAERVRFPVLSSPTEWVVP